MKGEVGTRRVARKPHWPRNGAGLAPPCRCHEATMPDKEPADRPALQTAFGSRETWDLRCGPAHPVFRYTPACVRRRYNGGKTHAEPGKSAVQIPADNPQGSRPRASFAECARPRLYWT